MSLSSSSELLPQTEVILDSSIVFYRGYTLTPICHDNGRFSCRIQAPENGNLLRTVTNCQSAGNALVQGQLWVMQHLGCTLPQPTTPMRKARVYRRAHK